ncbi:heme exporter protein B [Iodidimonas nitroreducens]|uniref:Heme exporter protein B n=1 Tax=Iodidimonas nitroreducens TaxID=1236968 RepID=A0A5A7N5R7_9PROT|nr:heme exporter protein CcmB [Iodidimonas nitroreducens]GAK32471.1 heme exporter protein B [alpha proteobacterium Q-1]GER02760.1 heme exporter protein B [Iodidimonas nitroreducens]
MLRAFFILMMRDIGLSYKQGGAAGLVIAFYAVAISLFPFGVGPDSAILARIAGGVLWIAALLSALLSLDRLFQADYEDGTLDALALGPLPLPLVVLAKALAHWLAMLLPLVILSPLFGLMLHLEAQALPTLFLALLIGTPALSLLGAVAAGLTVAVRRGGALIALLVLPLYIPTLIFGVGAVDAVDGLASVSANLNFLGGLSLMFAVLGPLATAGALRLAME